MIKLTKKHIAEAFQNKNRVFIFLDYDGTLAPIVREPKAAKLPSATKKTLRQLAGKKKFILGVVSGRLLSDIKKRLGLKNIVYAGSHGLEIEYKKKRLLPKDKLQTKSKLVLKKAKSQLAKNLKGISGVILEDKGLILAVHYRKVALTKQKRVVKIFKELSKPFLSTKLLKIGSGKKVLELRPNIAFTKADSVNFFHKKFKKTKNDLTLFFGDDLTDEDVFKILKKPDLGVRIGLNRSSQAKYYLSTPKQLSQYLRYISKLS